MEIKSRIIPAKPRNKELYFLKGTSGNAILGSSSNSISSSASYWKLIDTDEFDLPLENPYILTNYPILTKVVQPEPIIDPENPEAPIESVSKLNYLQIGDARLVYEDGALKVIKENGDPLSFYATGELSAYVLSENENPENPNSTLFSIANATDVILTNPSNDDLLKYNGTKWVNVPMSSLVTGGGGSTVTWGTESGGYVPLTVEGVSKSVALSSHTHSQYASSTHTHSISQVDGLQTVLNGKVDDSQVLTDVPANAKFTDTIYTHPSHTSRTSGLYKITVNSLGHVTGATAVIKTDITELGIPAQDTTYDLATTSVSGLMSATDKVKLNGIATGATANTGTVTSVGLSVPTGLSVSGTPITTSGTLSVSLASGYSIPTTTKQTNWTTAYDDKINSASLTASTLTLTRQDGGEVTASVPTWNQDTTGTAGKAIVLANSRTIWGQSFNGSANVSGALTGVTSISMNNALTGATTIEALTSITTPKVIFKTAGWSMEQSSTGVLELKYNGVIKQKFLNDGSIAATGELTAYVAGASGYSEFLPLSGGT